MDNQKKLSEEKRVSRNTKIVNKVVIIILALAVVFYIALSLFFTNHYYIGTKINEEAYSAKSPSAVTKEFIQSIEDYDLVITGRDEVVNHILGKDIDLKYQESDTLETIAKEQNGWLWFTAFFKNHEYEYEKATIFDEVKLQTEIEKCTFMEAKNSKQPKDAYISEYQEKEGYTIIPEVEGSIVDKEKVRKEIIDAVGSAEDELDLNEADCYKKPKLTKESAELVKNCERLNSYINVTITYDFEIAEEVVDRNQIKDWLVYSNTEADFDAEKVREYVNATARKYDTFGKNRKFVTMSGNEVELLSGGYGWRVDRAAETEQLITDIKAGKDVKREMIYVSKGYVRKDNGEGGVDDIGDTYVEINLGEQHLYVVKDKEVIEESDFVSGKIINGNGTPPGVFGITYKERNATLKGASYESHVNYWMPFNGNIGMHDATWRKEFGGKIYITNGSHGCVNLPIKKAENIYELVEKGMPVVCYY